MTFCNGGAEGNKRVAVIPLVVRRASRKTDTFLHTRVARERPATGKFLPMFKVKEVAGLLYTILMQLMQRVFCEVEPAIRNVLT
jgi:hypothetical protein